jgi:uroporphyrinogen decarboxylase
MLKMLRVQCNCSISLQMDRISAVIKKQTKYAVFPIVCVDHCAHIIDESFKDIAYSGEKIAEVLEFGYNRYQYDMVLIFLDAYVEAQALGCPVAFNPYPTLLGPGIDRSVDRTKEIIKAAQILKSKLEVPVFVSIKGPFTLAAFITGIENFLKMVIKNPKKAQDQIKYVTAFQTKYLEGLLKCGVNIIIGDPVASASVISPGVFRDFAYGPLNTLITQTRKHNAISGIHICGDTKPLIPMLDDLNPDFLSIENIELTTNTTKMGGVSTSTILQGSPEEITCEVKKAMADPYVIVSTSCDVPVNTASQNITHMIACAHAYSRH